MTATDALAAGDGDAEVVAMLASSVGAFLARRHQRRRLRDGTGGLDLWREMAELGLTGLTLPVADGGLGPSAVAAVGRIFGEQLIPEPFVACAVMPAAVIGALDAGGVRDELVAALVEGAERLGLAWQEAPHQMAGFPCGCRIGSDGRISGEKRFVIAADRRVLVTAMGADGPCIALADLAAPGVTVVSQAASDGAAYATLRFEGAAALSLIVGTPAEVAMAAAFDLGLLAVAAQLTGLADGVLALTLEHLRTRVQFERPIGSFQALQHRAVDMRISLALAEASLREAVRLMEARSPHASAAASAAKARASATALSLTKEAIQMHGAIAFTEEADVGLFARAALKWSGYLGGARDHRRRFVVLGGDLIDDE